MLNPSWAIGQVENWCGSNRSSLSPMFGDCLDMTVDLAKEAISLTASVKNIQNIISKTKSTDFEAIRAIPNPYPESSVDDYSGIIVSNDLYVAAEAMRRAILEVLREERK